MVTSSSIFSVLASKKISLGVRAFSRTSETQSWCNARQNTIKCENVFERAAILEMHNWDRLVPKFPSLALLEY